MVGAGGWAPAGFGGTGLGLAADFGFFAAGRPAAFFTGGFKAASFPAALGAAVFPAAGFFTDFDETEPSADSAADFFAFFNLPEIAEDWAAALAEAVFFVPALFSIN
jgi:hypothetical protein